MYFQCLLLSTLSFIPLPFPHPSAFPLPFPQLFIHRFQPPQIIHQNQCLADFHEHSSLVVVQVVCLVGHEVLNGLVHFSNGHPSDIGIIGQLLVQVFAQ